MSLTVKSLSRPLGLLVEYELARGNRLVSQHEDAELGMCVVSFAQPLDLEGIHAGLKLGSEVESNTFGPGDPDFERLAVEDAQLGFICLKSGHWVGGPDPHPPAPAEEVLALLCPALRAVVDAELKRGNHLFSAYDEDGFIQVMLQEPIDFDRHQPPASVERFRSASPAPSMPALAGYGDNDTGHSLAAPDAGDVQVEASAPEEFTPAEHNRRLPTDLDPVFEWSELDSAYLEKAKRRTEKGFKWTKETSLRSATEVMLSLWAVGREAEALEAAYFLSQLLFEGDFNRWSMVEPAHALIARHARDTGDLELVDMARQTLLAPEMVEDRLQGVVADHARENAELQRPGSPARRDWLLVLVGELLVLDVVTDSGAHSAEIDEVRTQLGEMLR